ncbi:MAG: hypothetical protein P4L69_14555 [Desulfosporosinus sp.]|nr:hypothetical protein [Desulfosporosinus sp.]
MTLSSQAQTKKMADISYEGRNYYIMEDALLQYMKHECDVIRKGPRGYKGIDEDDAITILERVTDAMTFAGLTHECAGCKGKQLAFYKARLAAEFAGFKKGMAELTIREALTYVREQHTMIT